MHTVVVSMLYAYSRKILLLSTLASMHIWIILFMHINILLEVARTTS